MYLTIKLIVSKLTVESLGSTKYMLNWKTKIINHFFVQICGAKMKNLSKVFLFIVPIIGIVSFGMLKNNVEAGNNVEPTDSFNNDEFPKELKYLLPPPSPILSDPNRDFASERVAYGAVDPTEELEQPIAYSHKLHAGELKIQCQYCHTYAKRSIHAGIPSTEICMNCHGESPNGIPRVDPTGKPELYKLLSYNYGSEVVINKYAKDEKTKSEIAKVTSGIQKQEIPWVKVHDLPDFVHFTHKRHVKAGIECQECHGEVQEDMTVGRRVNELTMGWCLTCHESHPSIQENYCTEEEIAAYRTCDNAELRRTEIKDCYTCHK